jgi:hypothetical protein
MNTVSHQTRMGGEILTWMRYCQIMSERAVLEVTATSHSSASSHSSSYSGAHWTTNTASTKSTLTAAAKYKYWVRWEDGVEELHDLPFDARKDQKLAFCFARRMVSDSKQGPTTLTGKQPIFIDESDVNEKSEVIGLMNLDTGIKYSIGQSFVLNRATEAGKNAQGSGLSAFMISILGTLVLTFVMTAIIVFLFGAKADNMTVIGCVALISLGLATWLAIVMKDSDKKENLRWQEFSDSIELIALSSLSNQRSKKPLEVPTH